MCPTYFESSFSDKIEIMIPHYVIHPHLKPCHYVIYATIYSVHFKLAVMVCVSFSGPLSKLRVDHLANLKSYRL